MLHSPAVAALDRHHPFAEADQAHLAGDRDAHALRTRLGRWPIGDQGRLDFGCVAHNGCLSSRMLKTCSRCQKRLEPSNFHRDKSRPDGRCGCCKKCKIEQVRAYAKSPRGREMNRAYRHSDHVRSYKQRSDVIARRRQLKQARRQRAEVKTKELAFSRAYEARPATVARRAAYRQTDARAEAISRYSHSQKCRDASKVYRLAHIDKARAREALNDAIREGHIRKGPCAQRGTDCAGRIHGHHHAGYDRPNWFNVTWLCRHHHSLVHETAEGLPPMPSAAMTNSK